MTDLNPNAFESTVQSLVHAAAIQPNAESTTVIAQPEASEFARVGRMKDAHGIKGELFILLFAGEAAWLDQLKEIRLQDELRKNPPVVLPVKSVRLHKNGLIAKCVDLKTRNDAEALKGLFFEIPCTFLVAPTGEEPYLDEVLGFSVIDATKGPIGHITGFSHNGAQDLLIIETPAGKFDVPFVEAFVINIDYSRKLMRLDIPHGLLGETEEEDVSPAPNASQTDIGH